MKSRLSLQDLLAPGSKRAPILLASGTHRVTEADATSVAEGRARPDPVAPPIAGTSDPKSREPWQRFQDEAWNVLPATWQPVEGVPVRAPHVAAPFVVVNEHDLVDIAIGTPATDGEDVYFPIDDQDAVFRVRTALGTRLVQVSEGRVDVYDDPADVEPWLDPPLAAWLADRAAPVWIEREVAARCAAGTTYHAFCGVGLCLRRASASLRPGLAETLAAIKAGRRPALHERVFLWLDQDHVSAGLDEVESTALRLAQALAERLLHIDIQDGVEPEAAVAMMVDRDDLESARAVLRLARRAEPLEQMLHELDAAAEGRTLLLEDAAARWHDEEPVLEATGESDEDAWWGLR